MPVPSSIADLSTTPASNSPAGSESVGTAMDDYLRTAFAIIKQQDSKGTDIASSGTITIPNSGWYFVVTGTTTINAVNDSYFGREIALRFNGVLQLTHSSGLILPGSANITTASGDVAIIVNESTGVWRCVSYEKANGREVIGPSGSITASGYTQSTARILGRTTASTGAIEEISVGTGLTLSGGSLTASGGAQIQPISASVGASALTISASALSLDFRSATLGSGTVTTVTGTPSNLVISSGSTLGTVSGQQSRIVVLAINNAGTIELAAVNVSGGNDLTETGLISTTAEGGAGAADSANVIYSTTARTNVAYRVIGYIESTQATAGTWATAPSTIQGAGGNALTAMSSLGYGQTWQDVAASRNFGTTYYNTTGRSIQVSVENTGAALPTVVVGGTTLPSSGASGNVYGVLNFTVPPGASYSITSGTKGRWTELR